VLELKKGANPKFVINSLYKYTRMQDSFNVNFWRWLMGNQNFEFENVVEEYVFHRKKLLQRGQNMN